MQFKDIVGQAEIKARLVRSVDEGRVSHAQIFTGAPGSGTLPLALAYAQYLNCTARSGGDSCGVCPSCVKMKELAHPDVNYVFPINSSKGTDALTKLTSDNFVGQWREINKTSWGYFDQAAWYDKIDIANKQGIISRGEADEIIRKLSFKAYEAQFKIMIIWLPEKMRTEAANALLKILEEPWDKTIFLLVSAEPRKLLPTIISRVQEVAVPGIETAEMEKILVERHGLDAGKASVVARLAGGSLIEAERLMSVTEDEESDEAFNFFVQLMRLSYNDRHMELLEWAEGVSSLGREQQKRFLVDSLRLLRESYMLGAGMDNVSYLWGAELDFCKKFSPFIANHNVEPIAAEIETAIAQIGQNGNSKIIFSHFALAVSKMIVRV